MSFAGIVIANANRHIAERNNFIIIGLMYRCRSFYFSQTMTNSAGNRFVWICLLGFYSAVC